MKRETEYLDLEMKIFTDSCKWDDKWFRSQSPQSKLIYLYICDVSDHAGVWEFDGDLLRLHLKVDWSDEKIESLMVDLKPKVNTLPNGKYFIKNYITFQNPKGISRKFKHCAPIYRSLEKNNIDPKEFQQSALDLNSEGKEDPADVKLVKEVMDLWNATCTGLRTVERVTTKRKKLILDAKERGVVFFEVFNMIRQSSFLMGRSSEWQCNFDWALKKENTVKILEGNYHSGTDKNRRSVEDDEFIGGF